MEQGRERWAESRLVGHGEVFGGVELAGGEDYEASIRREVWRLRGESASQPRRR